MIKSLKDTNFTTPVKKKIISRDVEFDEEGAWNWKVNKNDKYDFLVVLDKKKVRYKGHQKLVTPQQSPMNLTLHLSYYSCGNSSSGSPLSPPKKMKSLDDLYKITNPIDDDLTLIILSSCHM